MSQEISHTYVYKRGRIVDTEKINENIQRQTTYYLVDSTIDVSRVIFADANKVQLLQYEHIFTEEQILKTFYIQFQCKIGSDTENKDYYYHKYGTLWFSVDENTGNVLMYNKNSDGTVSQVAFNPDCLQTSDQILRGYVYTTFDDEVYYSIDNADELIILNDNDILSITKKYINFTETTYIDVVKKQIYREKRALDVPDNYQFVAAITDIYKNIKNEYRLRRFINTLVNCEYYGKHYLPQQISVGETNCSKIEKFISLISSTIISYQRIDAEENLNPKYIKEIQKAFGDNGNSILLRDIKTMTRNIITIPTLPLVIPYYMIAVYAWNQIGN